MASPCPSKNPEKVWLMSSCMPFINRTFTKEFSWFWGGINKIEGAGNPNFLPSLSFSFFYNQHTPSNATFSNLAFLRAHLPYLGDYVHFLGINQHNSNSNNQCMKGWTRMVWKTVHMVFSKFSSLLQGTSIDFKRMHGNSQPQTRHLLGYQQ